MTHNAAFLPWSNLLCPACLPQAPLCKDTKDWWLLTMQSKSCNLSPCTVKRILWHKRLPGCLWPWGEPMRALGLYTKMFLWTHGQFCHLQTRDNSLWALWYLRSFSAVTGLTEKKSDCLSMDVVWVGKGLIFPMCRESYNILTHKMYLRKTKCKRLILQRQRDKQLFIFLHKRRFSHLSLNVTF